MWIPLIENAIRHAGGTEGDRRPIVITGIVRGARLTLTVRNRGTLGEIDAGTSPDRPQSGFGLSYVRERLVHFYGNDASLALKADGGDVVAVLDVPLRTVAGIAA